MRPPIPMSVIGLLTAVLALSLSAMGSPQAADAPQAVNAKAHGAKGDGTTDDAMAIQKAIDQAAVHGGVVLLPAGTYRVLPQKGSTCGSFVGDGADGKSQYALNLSDNVTLRGEGPGATVLRVDPQGSYAVINVRAKQARVEGLAIVSGQAPPGINGLWGVLLNSARQCIVEDCRFEKLSVGVLFTGAQECRADRCQARTCRGNGLLMYASSRSVIENSIVDACGDGNCSIYGSNTDCHIRGCTLLNADQCGVLESALDCSIRNCTVDGGKNGYMGLVVNRSPRAAIEENTIKNFHHGIHVRETDIAGSGGMPCVGTRIRNNTITGIVSRTPGNPNYPIFVSFGFGTLVSGNLLAGNDAPAEISISGRDREPNYSQANCVVTNNIFILTQATYGEGFAEHFAHSHPCIVANVGVTVTGNSITSYGAKPIGGLSTWLIDVGPGSVVTGNRNGGLPGLIGGADRFIRVGRDSLVTDNFCSWHERTGPVVELSGPNCIARGNRLMGPSGIDVPVIQVGQSCVVEGNLTAK